MVRRVEDWTPSDWFMDKLEDLMDRLLDKMMTKK